ncbi:MAG TPA: YggS family pyridoxal phosphate-dependent enzyme [Planctomycetaceae bacterium]|nr:YggS family pyridoxal phosphate-dependent enzyme [Planctomycetaceae bacterium]
MQADATTQQIISDNWAAVQAEVRTACEAASRSTDSVRIVGVSKYVDPPFAAQLFRSGCEHLGENRPQHLWAAQEHFVELGLAAKWHMIGHFQRNKVRRTLPMLTYLHSLDSQRLTEVLADELTKRETVLPVLLEVNVSQDDSKTGLPPDQAERLLAMLVKQPVFEVKGLMAMSTLGATEDEARREFAKVRTLRDQLQDSFAGQVDLRELSMGMSGDFPQAIAEGATLVRIGTRLWRGIL